MVPLDPCYYCSSDFQIVSEGRRRGCEHIKFGHCTSKRTKIYFANFDSVASLYGVDSTCAYVRIITMRLLTVLLCCSITKSCLTLWPHGLTAACQASCPSSSPGVCSNSCPLSRWCYLTISSSATFSSFCLLNVPKNISWVKSLSRIRLFATPWTVAHQAPPSMEFSRQEYWRGLPFPFPGDLPQTWVSRIEGRSLTLWATRESLSEMISKDL